MSREKNLLKNTAIITIGKICTQLITFFLLPLYTSILSTAEYGTVDLLNTLVSLLLPIVTFQIEQAVFRSLIDNRENHTEQVKTISTSIIIVLIQSTIYLSIFFIIAPFVNNEYKYFLATNVIAYIFSSLLQQIARGLGKNTQYAMGSFISAFSTIMFNIIFLLVFKFGAKGMLIANMIGQLICTLYIFLELKIYKYINVKEFRKKVLTKLWKYSMPLIPNAISWWIFNASDRVIVSTLLDLSSTGLLSAANKFSSVYITFYNIFNMSWTENIALHIKDADIKEYFNKMFNIVLKIFVAMGIGMIACMPFVYPIMINEKFNEGYGLVPILIIASFFNVVVGLISVIYVAKKNTKAIANTSVVSAGINIIVHLALIKFIGLYAAAISTFVSFFIMSIYRIYDINRKYFKINIEKNILIMSFVVLSIVLVTYYLNNKYLCLISLLITIIYAYLINKDSLQMLLKMLKEKVHKRNEEIL